MTATLVALAFATAAGAPIAKRLDPDAPLLRWAGLSFLCGLGLCTFVLFAFALSGVRWTLWATSAAIVIVSVAFTRRSSIRFERIHPLDMLSVLALVAYGCYATASSSPWESDFINIWGLKARIFELREGISWPLLQNPWYSWSHPDYPLLVPLTFDFASLFAGRWATAGVGAIYVAFAAAAFLVIRSLAEDELPKPVRAAVAAFIALWLIVTPWIGLADGPLVAYSTCAILYIRRRNFAAGSVLLGLAANCKNEGLSFIVAVAVGMLCDRELRRNVLRLWPAVAIALPWLIARNIQHLATDLASGPIGQRVIEHVLHPGEYLRLLVRYGFGQWLFWAGAILAVAIAGWAGIVRERFAIATVATQFAAYIGAYLVTPLEVSFHIRWSWDRLLAHLMPVIAITLLLNVLPVAFESSRSRRLVAVDEQDGSAV